MSSRRPTWEMDEPAPIAAEPGDWGNNLTGRTKTKLEEMHRRMQEVDESMRRDNDDVQRIVNRLARRSGYQTAAVGGGAVGIVAAILAAMQYLGVFSPETGWLFESKKEAAAEHQAIRQEISELKETIPDATAKRVLEGLKRGRR